jgi:hypothetical protein
MFNGDYVFGQVACPHPEFWVDQPEGVAQAIQTRLLLMAGEWFLDLNEGTPYNTQILGKGTMALYDSAIKARILTTIGVSALLRYSSSYDLRSRSLTIEATVLTVFSQAALPLSFVIGGSSPLPNAIMDAYGNVSTAQPVPSTPSAPPTVED